MERDEKREDQMKAVGFAAGMAACMACIQRAAIVSMFVHWRVWAFLALNLLLLAILFISKFQNYATDQDTDSKKDKTRHDQCGAQISTAIESAKDNHETRETTKNEEEKVEDKDDCVGKEDCEGDDEVSKEELNQRVEAFIAMFRQQLVCDAKNKSYGV